MVDPLCHVSSKVQAQTFPMVHTAVRNIGTGSPQASCFPLPCRHSGTLRLDTKTSTTLLWLIIPWIMPMINTIIFYYRSYRRRRIMMIMLMMIMKDNFHSHFYAGWYWIDVFDVIERVIFAVMMMKMTGRCLRYQRRLKYEWLSFHQRKEVASRQLTVKDTALQYQIYKPFSCVHTNDMIYSPFHTEP